MRSKDSADGATTETEAYDAMLDDLETGIDALRAAIEADAVEDPEAAKVKVQQYRTLGYLIRTKRQVLKDRTLVDLAEQVAHLEAELEPTDEVSLAPSEDR